MNKRIKKKLQNRFGYKKYSEYRIQRIYKALKDQIDNDTILYIVTGKRPNNKHFHSIKLLKHGVPNVLLSMIVLRSSHFGNVKKNGKRFRTKYSTKLYFQLIRKLNNGNEKGRITNESIFRWNM